MKRAGKGAKQKEKLLWSEAAQSISAKQEERAHLGYAKEPAGGDEAPEENRKQILLKFEVHFKDFGFYSKCNGET